MHKKFQAIWSGLYFLWWVHEWTDERSGVEVKAPYVLENKNNGVNQNLPVSNLCTCN